MKVTFRISFLLMCITGLAKAQPSQQATAIIFSAFATDGMTVSWTNGNGIGRILVAKEGSPVDVTPLSTDLYTPITAFGDPASELGAGTQNYVIANLTGTDNSTPITNLKPATVYYFQVFEYTELAGIKTYNTSTATGNPGSRITLAVEPTVQASAVSFSSLTSTTVVVNWTNGDGIERLLVASGSGAISNNPIDGSTYTGNADYSTSTDLGGGNKVIFRGAGSSVEVTGLTPGVQYAFKVFELNGSGASTNYNITDNTTNPATTFTYASEPDAHAASFTATSVGSNQIDLSFSAASTISNAAGYVILRRQDGTTPTAEGITDGTTVAANPVIGTVKIATITNTAITSFTDVGVSGTAYIYAIIPYGYNSTDVQTYNYRTAATIPSAMSGTLPVKLLYFESNELNQDVVLTWATTMEVDFRRFVIQRSNDGLSFEDLGDVSGQGFNIYHITSRYSFTDEAPLLSYNYYRIKAEDLDGTSQYFRVTAIILTLAKEFAAFPNPSAGNEISYRTNFSASKSDRVVLLDPLGIEIFSAYAASIENHLSFPELLPSGIYMLRYISKGFEQTTRVVVKNR